MSRRGDLKMAAGSLRETFEYAVGRKDLQKLYAAELFVLLGTVIAVTAALDTGVLSLVEGMVVLAVVSVGELLFEARYTG